MIRPTARLPAPICIRKVERSSVSASTLAPSSWCSIGRGILSAPVRLNATTSSSGKRASSSSCAARFCIQGTRALKLLTIVIGKGCPGRVLLQQLLRVVDLFRQLSKAHAPALQERTLSFDCCPGGPNKLGAQRVEQPVIWHAQVGGQVLLRRPIVPGEPNAPAEVDSPIRGDRWFETCVCELILPSHPPTDRVSHTTGCAAVDAS